MKFILVGDIQHPGRIEVEADTPWEAVERAASMAGDKEGGTA